MQEWDKDAAGDKVGPGLPVGCIGWGMGPFLQQERTEVEANFQGFEALSIGWHIDVYFACFELVTGLWLGDAPASGLPSTL